VTATVGSAAVNAGLALAVAGALLSALGAGVGDRRLVAAGRVAALLLLPAAAVAAGALTWALLAHDFSIAYVAQNGSRATPVFYTAVTLWGRLEGSLLLWILVLAGFVAATAVTAPRRAPQLYPVAQCVLLVIAAFFLWLAADPADPFVRVFPVPADGPGPNPLLQNHPLMAIHPPLLYVGLVGFSVPFAFAVAALTTGRLDDRWITVTRTATLVAWAFLALGIVIGGAWSYAVLGWGGYYAWDPVENASLLPWLTATALIHSMMVQERRDMLRLWNVTLVVATFLLTILTTFLTRSGVLSSVHAFSEGAVGPALLTFIGAGLALSVGLLVWRGERLRGTGELDAPVCRESAFLLNNLLLVGLTLTVLLGTLFPLIAEAIDGSRLTVGEPYFNATAVPIMLALLFLMGVGPALPWRRASGAVVRRRLTVPGAGALGLALIAAVFGLRRPEALLAVALGGFVAAAVAADLTRLARRRALGAVPRRVGGQVAHLGVALMAVGIAVSSTYQIERQATLRQGEAMRVAGRTVWFERLSTAEEPRRRVVRAELLLEDGRRLRPALNTYRNSAQATASPGIRSGVLTDVYAVLVEGAADGSAATIRVYRNPLVSWIWAGGGLLVVGAGIALVPPRRRRRTA
jgi:cytochrome c-type biogenesis protein CcmF